MLDDRGMGNDDAIGAFDGFQVMERMYLTRFAL